MSIEKITSKIMNDAESSARVILERAQSESDAILAEADGRAARLVSQAKEKGMSEKEKLIKRKKSVADIDGRKIILEEKQKLISECFDKAIDRIISLDSEKYIEFLAATVKNTGFSEGELIFNENEAKTVGPRLVEVLSKEISGSKIVLSDKTQKMRGGYILVNGSVFINGTIEALVEEAREELVAEVAKELFQ